MWILWIINRCFRPSFLLSVDNNARRSTPCLIIDHLGYTKQALVVCSSIKKNEGHRSKRPRKWKKKPKPKYIQEQQKEQITIIITFPFEERQQRYWWLPITHRGHWWQCQKIWIGEVFRTVRRFEGTVDDEQFALFWICRLQGEEECQCSTKRSWWSVSFLLLATSHLLVKIVAYFRVVTTSIKL